LVVTTLSACSSVFGASFCLLRHYYPIRFSQRTKTPQIRFFLTQIPSERIIRFKWLQCCTKFWLTTILCRARNVINTSTIPMPHFMHAKILEYALNNRNSTVFLCSLQSVLVFLLVIVQNQECSCTISMSSRYSIDDS
jgi:hypothetical protein